MCILFMFVANCAKQSVNAKPAHSQFTGPATYKLILAFNRDEKYSRPSKSAVFWENEDSHILAGQDMQDKGTWLGISKHGKIAVVLNVMGAHSGQYVASAKPQSNGANSRGSLATGFLRTPPGLSGWAFCSSLCQDIDSLDIRKEYKPFHLITIDVRGKNVCTENECMRHSGDRSSIRVTHLSNRKSSQDVSPQPQYMTPEVNTCQYYAFGNCVIDKPFRKVALSREEFMKIVTKYCGETASDQNNTAVTNELLQFLRSTEKYFPDDVINDHAKSSALPPSVLKHLSSRFVNVPGAEYGTRTQTIILIDANNNVTFREWTLLPPINPSELKWDESKYSFRITPSN